MDLQRLELHDARLLGLSVDPIERTVELRISYYLREADSKRIDGTVKFSGVTQLRQDADLLELADHHGPGNISRWIPALEGGTSYIHLVRGLIAVTADRVEMIDG